MGLFSLLTDAREALKHTQENQIRQWCGRQEMLVNLGRGIFRLNCICMWGAGVRWRQSSNTKANFYNQAGEGKHQSSSKVYGGILRYYRQSACRQEDLGC